MQQRSLKSRALQLLAQRDQSRVELRAKLVRHARSARPAAGDGAEGDAALDQAVAAIDPLLDWLEANGFLSNERFAEARVHARQSRFGLLRIRNELGRHEVALPAALERTLADSELDRAAAVRARRFRAPPGDAAERAAQSRFLLARGFAPELVHRLMRSLGRALPIGEEEAQGPD